MFPGVVQRASVGGLFAGATVLSDPRGALVLVLSRQPGANLAGGTAEVLVKAAGELHLPLCSTNTTDSGKSCLDLGYASALW